VTLWNGEIFLEAGHYPMWPDGFRLYAFENGGRRQGECLSLSLNIGKFHLNVTTFNMRWLPLLIGWVPDGKRGRGHAIGWPGPEPA
jgi:hypothetical protein